MKIKLLNGTEYAVVGATTKGNTLEIQLNKSVLTAEGAEEAFQDRAPLGKIEVYETTKKTSTLLGYVVLAEVRLKAGVVTVVLTKEADKTEQRITDAAAKAVSATEEAAAAKAEAEQLGATMEKLAADVDYIAMETGVEL